MFEAIMNGLSGLGAGVAHLQGSNLVMIAVGGVLLYLAIKKDVEPLLLVPIGCGAILVNIPLEYLFTIHDGSDRRATLKRVGSHAGKKEQRRTAHHDQEYGQDSIDSVAAVTRFRRGGLLRLFHR
jgi:Na+-transporting methylmalonyl-CoA/oxaloacetate decarboxylase beta subunit